MEITINEKIVQNKPIVVYNKYVQDISNALQYDFNAYDENLLSANSLLLMEDDIVKGIIRIEEKDAPKDIFLSSTSGRYISLEGIKQLQILNIDIPQGWYNQDVISSIFEAWQHDIRTYFEGNRVIVWFKHKHYHMCPVATNVFDDEYKNFVHFMTELFMRIMKESMEPNSPKEK